MQSARSVTALAVTIVLSACSAPEAWAQAWRGEAEVRGIVTTTEGDPIADATVELRLVDDPTSGPPSTQTDRRGRWRITRLAPGRYELIIRAVGFLNINGYATAPEIGKGKTIEAEMLPLSWEPPRFSEGNPNSNTLRLWIEKGNTLLEQGHPAAARELYERALDQLPRRRQPEVLRSVARTYYLEEELDAAVEALRRALEIDAEDEASRQLFVLLMDRQGRGDEALATLEQLDARGPAPVEEPTGSPPPPALRMPPEIREILDAPSDPPRPHRTGSYKVSFTERSQWSRVEEFASRFGIDKFQILAQDPTAGEYGPAGDSYQVLVPETYEPGEPWGLLIWISPTSFGGPRRAVIADALARHRLIWIGANLAGNGRKFWERTWLALDAAANMQRLYDIDPKRVYVGGYSGGGRIASQMGVLYPEVVHGAWALSGCDFYRSLPVVERPGTHYPPRYSPPDAKVLDRVKRRNRFVLVTGTRDFNFLQTRSIARAMEREGFEHVTYVEVPDADHYSFPEGEWLDRIFAGLDSD